MPGDVELSQLTNNAGVDPNQLQSTTDDDTSLAPSCNQDFMLRLLLVPLFVAKVAERMTIPVLPVFAKEELGASPTMIGTLTASAALGKLICNIPSGWLVSLFYQYHTTKAHASGAGAGAGAGAPDHKIGGHITQGILPVVLSTLVLTTAYIGAANATTTGQLVMARLLEGAGLSCFVIGNQTMINEMLTKQTRGRYMSIQGGISRMAAIVGPYLGGFLAKNNLRWPFWGQAALNLTCAVLLVAIMVWSIQGGGGTMTTKSADGAAYTAVATTASTSAGEDDATTIISDEDSTTNQGPNLVSKTTKEQQPAQSMTWSELFSQFGLTLAILAVFCFCTGVMRESRHLLFPLQAMEMGYDVHAIGIMTSITFFVDTMMFPVAGYLMDHYGRKYAGIPSHVVMGLSSASVPVLTSFYPTSIVALTIASAGWGIGNGLSSGLLMSLGGDLSPTQGQDRAKFLAMFRSFADSGWLLGPWVSGLLADHFSVTVGFQVLAGIAATGASWMAFIMPETHGPQQATTQA